MTAPMDAARAVRNAHAWFEVNSGWCRHGLASWHLILTAEGR